MTRTLHEISLGRTQRLILGRFAKYGACTCGWARTAIVDPLPSNTHATPAEVLDAMLISGHSLATDQRSNSS